MKTPAKILFTVALFELLSKALVSHAALTPFDPTAIPDSNLKEMIQAGSPTGLPPDSAANRIDPNVPTSFLAGVGSIFIDAHLPGGGGYFGSGTPISRWQILTAAHLFDRDNNGTVDVAPGDVSFFSNNNGNLTHTTIAGSLTIHPDFTGFANPSVNDDLAIITLASPLPADVTIYPLLPPGHIAPEEPLLLAGYGLSGDGMNGYTGSIDLAVKRSGYNLLEAADLDDEGSGKIEVFGYDFENSADVANTDVFGDKTALGNDIETIVGPGDSGGPAFVELGSKWYLAGVNTFTDSKPGDDGKFGSVGGGIWLESYEPWIESHITVPDTGGTLALLGLSFGILVRFRPKQCREG